MTLHRLFLLTAALSIPPGTGFIRFFAGDGSPGRPQNFIAVQAVAETRPK